MEPTKDLLDSIERERIERARRMNPLDKALAGARLYDAVRRRMAFGVRMDHPDADEATVNRIVSEQMALNRD